MTSNCNTTTSTSFEAKRVQRSATFLVQAPIEVAFPLFGPIKEKLWEESWNPQIIYSISNDVEEHMVFKTKSTHGEQEPYIWVISQYRPHEHFIEYLVSTSQRIWFITVDCQPSGGHTRVLVTYTFTGLTEEGNKLNEQALNRMYKNDLVDWQDAINKYLSNNN